MLFRPSKMSFSCLLFLLASSRSGCLLSLQHVSITQPIPFSAHYMFLLNVCVHLQDYLASQSRSPQCWLIKTVSFLPSRLAQAAALLTYIWEVTGSDLGQNTSKVLHGFSQFLQANPRTLPHIRPQLHPFASFPMHYSLRHPVIWRYYTLRYWWRSYHKEINICFPFLPKSHFISIAFSFWARKISIKLYD